MIKKSTIALNWACLIAAIAGVWWYFDSSEKSEKAAASRPVVEMKWDDVRARYSENGVAAANYFKKNKMILSGTVQSVHQALGFAGTILMDDGSKEPALIAIDSADNNRIAELKAGQLIAVICGDAGLGIMPTDCRIK